MKMLKKRRPLSLPLLKSPRFFNAKAPGSSQGRRMTLASLLLAPLLVSSLAAAAVSPLVLVGIGKADSKLEFLAKGPLGLKIVGKSRGYIDANEKGSNIEIVASMKHFDTGIKLRDDHLRDTIEADKYPTATIQVARSALKFPADQKKLQGSAKGQLTFHGKSNPIQFKYQAARTGSDYHIKGKLTFKITDFGLEKPCHLGQCVDENVKIKTAFKLREK